MNSLEHDEENTIHQNIDNENESFSDAESFHSSDFSDHTEDSDDIKPNVFKRQHDLSGTEGASSLMNLFSPEPLPSMTSPAKSVNSQVSNSSKSSFYLSQPVLERMITERRSNGTSRDKMSEQFDWVECLNDTTPLLSPPRTRLTHSASKKMHSMFESDERCGNDFPCRAKCPSISRETIKNTVVGSITAVIFQIVYCIAMSSAIHRPYSNRAVLGQMVRLAAIGPLLGGPIFLYILGGTYPALYPMLDVFPAPFFYSMAAIVDQDLVEIGKADDDILFLNTFCLLSSMSLILTGALIVIGTKIKIANLASFLPYPVMSGFFTAIGFLCWTLSFSVDTSGKNVWSVLFSGNLHLILTCMKHHIGSLITGFLLSVFGKRNSLYIPLLLILPSVIVYSTMSLRKMTLEQARNDGWFWHETDFKVYDTVGTSKFFVSLSWEHLFEKWTCPLPFGLILGIVQGRVHYKSAIRGLPTVISMAIIYFIRCAVHAPALQKSARGLAQWQQERENTLKSTINGSANRSHARAMSQYDASFDFLETEDEHDIFESSSNKLASTNVSNVLYNYGKILSFSGILNGFTVLPTIGSSVALFKMGAGDLPPQIGSLVLLCVFYLAQFDIVGYIPKMTFR